MVPKQCAAARRDLATGLVAMRTYGDGHALTSTAARVAALSGPRRRCWAVTCGNMAARHVILFHEASVTCIGGLLTSSHGEHYL